MKMSIGCDVEKISRFDGKIEDDAFLSKIYTDFEINYCKSRGNISSHLAARFCAKEAFSKAIGIGIGRGIDMRDIIIKKDSLGKPSILLTDKGYTFIEKYYEKERTLIQFNISITDEPPYVNSFVIISLNHE